MGFDFSKYKSKILKFLLLFLIVHVLILILFYFKQERVLFQTRSTSKHHTFQFKQPFEELFIDVSSDVQLNALLFKTESPRGVVLFFHGNGGSLSQWGHDAKSYLNLGYDVLFVDYRGYGKSGGAIESESQFIADGQATYDYLKTRYTEDQITLVGMSMGTGVATQLAASNNPNRLILMAPYYGLEELIKEKAFVVPRYVIRYKLASYEYIENIDCPIFILHGKDDRLIPIHHAERLVALNKEIKLLPLDKCEHMVGRCGRTFESALAVALEN